MKAFSKSVVVMLLLAACSTIIVKSRPSVKARPGQFDRYLSSLGSQIYSSMARAPKHLSRAPRAPLPRAKPTSLAALRSLPRRLRLRGKGLAPAVKAPVKRKLYDSLTYGNLMGHSDDSATVNQLTVLMSEEKNIHNIRTVNGWINDIETSLDDMRDSINRRVSDIATGLQRRNMLLGHYNYVNNANFNGNNPPPGMTANFNANAAAQANNIGLQPPNQVGVKAANARK